MKHFRYIRLLLVSGAVALGGATAASQPAHALTSCCIHPVYAPPGNLTLYPTTGWTCPTLYVGGYGFDKNDPNPVVVTLNSTDAYGNPNGTYTQARDVWVNGSGGIYVWPPFLNTTVNIEYWRATAEEVGHFTAYSNIIECH